MKEKVVQLSVLEAHNAWTALKNGEVNALGTLYDLYANKLFAIALQINGNRDLAKDEIHNLFLDLYKYEKKLADVKNIEGYLVIALKRRLYKHGNSKVINFENEWEIQGDQVVNSANVVISHEEKLVREEHKTEDHNRLERIMSKLTEHQQKILRLRFNEGKTYEEIAEDLGLNVSSARTLVYRTLKTIRNTALTLFF